MSATVVCVAAVAVVAAALLAAVHVVWQSRRRLKSAQRAPPTVAEVEHDVEQQIALDDSRKAVIRRIVTHVCACCNAERASLDTGATIGVVANPRMSTLLLARKGGGKTELLSRVGQTLHSNGVVVVYVDYTTLSGALKLPSVALAETLGVSACTDRTRRFRAINKELVRRGTAALVIVDEVHVMFYGDCTNTAEVWAELGHLGCGAASRVACVVTGSSTHTRRLLFGKYSADDSAAFAFTHYKGRDLNETKFTPVWIHPFLHPNDFVELVTMMRQGLNQPQTAMTPEETARLYLETGGMPLRVRNALECAGDTHAMGLRGLARDIAEFALLKRIYNRTQEMLLAHGDAGDAAGMNTDSSTDSDVARALGPLYQCVRASPSFEKCVPELYNLADCGYITMRFTPDLQRLVALSSPMLFMQLSDMDLSPAEVLALRFPGQHEHLAEMVAWKCLRASLAPWCGGAADEAPCPLALELHPDPPHSRSVPAYLVQHGVTLVTRGNMPRGVVMKELYEHRDCRGADFVVVRQEGDQHIVTRMQLKLGTGSMQGDAFNGLVQAFRIHRDAVTPLYTAALRVDASWMTIQEVLVTTKQLTPAQRQELAAAGILVKHAGDLKRDVWPRCVRCLGKPYR